MCSLCHQDLRPAPAPEPVHQVPAAQPSYPSYGVHDPLTADLIDLVLPPVPVAAAIEAASPALAELSAMAAPAPQAEAPAVPAQRTAVWPCARCQTANPFTELHCTACGAAFLADVSKPQSLVVPGFGDLGRFSRGQRVGLACAVAGALLVPLAIFTYVVTPHSVSTSDKPASTPSASAITP